MNKTILYTLKGLYRDDFRVTGYEFGSGKKSVCILGSSRGNVLAVMNFLSRKDIIQYTVPGGLTSKAVNDADLISIKTAKSGFLLPW